MRMSMKYVSLEAPKFIQHTSRPEIFASRHSVSALRLEALEARARKSCENDPDLASLICQKWQINISYGGDGVKEVLARMKAVTPDPVMLKDPLRPSSEKMIPASDSFDARREVIKDLERLVEQIDGW